MFQMVIYFKTHNFNYGALDSKFQAGKVFTITHYNTHVIWDSRWPSGVRPQDLGGSAG